MQEQAKSYSHMRREFYEKYRKTIVPCVKRYENKRRTSLFAAILTSSLLAVIGGFIVFIDGAYYNLDTDTLRLALSCFVCSFMSWFWIKKKFENKIKTMIMPIVCSCFEN